MQKKKQIVRYQNAMAFDSQEEKKKTRRRIQAKNRFNNIACRLKWRVNGKDVDAKPQSEYN